MKVDVLDMQGKKIDTAELPAEIFEAPIDVDLMHQAFQRQMANARLGTHDTKTRSEVAGGGKKPWKQKAPAGRGRVPLVHRTGRVAAKSIHRIPVCILRICL